MKQRSSSCKESQSIQKILFSAREALQICAECEESLAEQLTALVGAMNDLQQRQQHCLAATLAAADHIRHKASERNSLLEGIARLGAAARSITQPIAGFQVVWRSHRHHRRCVRLAWKTSVF